jgi:hypothetical protein
MKLHVLLSGAGIVLNTAMALAAPPQGMKFFGRGTQIYSCQHSAAGYAWVLRGPDAHLYDALGKVAARHYFGPRWQANDGSTIKGTVLDANASPQAGKATPLAGFAYVP